MSRLQQSPTSDGGPTALATTTNASAAPLDHQNTSMANHLLLSQQLVSPPNINGMAREQRLEGRTPVVQSRSAQSTVGGTRNPKCSKCRNHGVHTPVKSKWNAISSSQLSTKLWQLYELLRCFDVQDIPCQGFQSILFIIRNMCCKRRVGHPLSFYSVIILQEKTKDLS